MLRESQNTKSNNKRSLKMISWLSSLFGGCPKEELKTLSAYKLEPKRTRNRGSKFTTETKRDMVTDYTINKLTLKEIATKFECSQTSVWKIVNSRWDMRI